MPKQHLILGGSFDPVHNGHLALCQALTNLFPKAELRIIPNYQSPLKHQAHASAEHRLAMLKLATVDLPNVIIDTYELDQQRPVYTIDTLEHLHQQYPNDQLILVLGSDLIEHFDKWRCWQDILALADLMVVTRKQHPLTSFECEAKLIPHDAVPKAASKVFYVDLSLPELSSSQVRQMLASRDNIQAYLPSNIVDYIATHRLYI